MIERSDKGAGCFDGDGQAFFQLGLADEFLEGLRAERGLDNIVVGQRCGGK